MEKQKTSFFNRVYGIVKGIPEGRVMTYGQVAGRLGTRDARRVGHALHANKDHVCPCHRVVNKEGRVAPSYAFGGFHEQRNRLLAEGVKFLDELHVDLSKCGCAD
jgi:methylated-DNA-protein-cysteine methyltransferase-like protein